MQLDGTMGAVSALLEMPVHSSGGFVHLFRGVPADWKDASFSRVRLSGGFTVSARQDGEIWVASQNGGLLHMKIADRLLVHEFRPGEEKIFT